MASATDSSKRRRLLGDDASPDASTCLLSELPSGILTHVANYLDSPSRLFFAAALTTHQNAAASDERNSAIVGNEWTTLDFGDIQKDLAAKLSDGDISAVLMCIDAVNRLKTLKLTNCIHITGAGLEPLRGSSIIEQIDLSLVGDHQSPKIISPKPPISRKFVLPILDSIIEREGCSLRHLQFPWSWRGESIQFEQFIERYNEMLDNRGIGCVKCNTNLPPENESWIDELNLQVFTCYECLKNYCLDCTNDDGEDVFGYCHNCKKMYCQDCEETKRCSCCDFEYCVSCNPFTECSGFGCPADICKDCIASDFKCIKCCRCEGHFCEDNCGNEISYQCNNCKMYICRPCDEEYIDWRYCNFCEKSFCNECNEKNGQKAIQFCEYCYTYYCGDCRVSSMCQVDGSTQDCTGCMQLTGPLLLEEVKKVRKEHAEVKAENGYKQDHINNLKEQLQYQKEQVKELEKKMKQLESGEDG